MNATHHLQNLADSDLLVAHREEEREELLDLLDERQQLVGHRSDSSLLLLGHVDQLELRCERPNRISSRSTAHAENKTHLGCSPPALEAAARHSSPRSSAQATDPSYAP